MNEEGKDTESQSKIDQQQEQQNKIDAEQEEIAEEEEDKVQLPQTDKPNLFLDFLNKNPYIAKISPISKQQIQTKLAYKSNDKDFDKVLQTTYSHFDCEILKKKKSDKDKHSEVESQHDDLAHSQGQFDEEKPDEKDLADEFYQKMIEEGVDKATTALEKQQQRMIANLQAKICVMEYEANDKKKTIDALTHEKINQSKQIEDFKKDKAIQERMSIKLENKIKKLEKSHEENEEMYKTLKHILNLNISEIEQNAINKARKLVKIHEFPEQLTDEKRPQSSLPTSQKGNLPSSLSGAKQNRPTTAVAIQRKQTTPELAKQQSSMNKIQSPKSENVVGFKKSQSQATTNSPIQKDKFQSAQVLPQLSKNK